MTTKIPNRPIAPLRISVMPGYLIVHVTDWAQAAALFRKKR